MVALVPIGIEVAGQQRRVSRAEADEGRTQFNSVIPGAYKVVAVSVNRLVAAAQDIYVEAGGTASAVLTLHRGIDLQGQLRHEDPLPNGFDPSRVRVVLTRVDVSLSGFLPSHLANVASDGAFVLRDVVPGLRYSLGLIDLSQSEDIAGYVGTVRYDGGDTLRQPFTIGNASRIEVQAGFRLGRIEAIVTEDGKPQKGIPTVVILTSGISSGVDRLAISDDAGKVVFDKLIPGDYFLFALEDVKEEFWFDRPINERLPGRGRRIRVEKGGTTTEVVEVIKLGTVH
jgi:hypothetical protein